MLYYLRRTTLANPVVEETPSKKEENPAGLGGFLKRIFSGGKSKEETTTEPKPVAAAPEPVMAEPANVESAEVEAVPPPPTLAQMQSRILESIEVTDDALGKLADERAEAVREFLVTSGEIASERLFVVEPEDPSSVSGQTGEPLVSFNLE